MAENPARDDSDLYTAPPDRFVALRNAAVEEAKTAGNRSRATEIARLRKPTVAAWLLNLLAIRRPDLLADLADLAASLRTAQRELRGAQLRDLSARRRKLITALVGAARDLAMAERPEPTANLPLAEVESVLVRALADEETTERIRSGRLVRTTSGAATTEPGATTTKERPTTTTKERPTTTTKKPDATTTKERPTTTTKKPDATTTKKPTTTTKKPDATTTKERATGKPAKRATAGTRRRDLTAARAAERAARAELDRAVAAERESAGVLADIEQALVELRARRVRAEEDLNQLRRVLRRARTSHDVAASRLADLAPPRDG